MTDCIFCKIVKGEIESVKIWEDDRFLAIFDANPNVEGMTLVLPKAHFDSDVFEMPGDVYFDFFQAAKTVSKILQNGLGVNRVGMVTEGTGVNHAHIKLYPMHGAPKEFEETWAKDRVFFDKYEGYLTTQLGPKADPAELKRVAEKINKSI